jgi:hypothetical protein
MIDGEVLMRSSPLPDRERAYNRLFGLRRALGRAGRAAAEPFDGDARHRIAVRAGLELFEARDRRDGSACRIEGDEQAGGARGPGGIDEAVDIPEMPAADDDRETLFADFLRQDFRRHMRIEQGDAVVVQDEARHRCDRAGGVFGRPAHHVMLVGAGIADRGPDRIAQRLELRPAELGALKFEGPAFSAQFQNLAKSFG